MSRWFFFLFTKSKSSGRRCTAARRSVRLGLESLEHREVMNAAGLGNLGPPPPPPPPTSNIVQSLVTPPSQGQKQSPIIAPAGLSQQPVVLSGPNAQMKVPGTNAKPGQPAAAPSSAEATGAVTPADTGLGGINNVNPDAGSTQSVTVGGKQFFFGLHGNTVVGWMGDQWQALPGLLGEIPSIDSFSVVNNNDSIAVTGRGTDGNLYQVTYPPKMVVDGVTILDHIDLKDGFWQKSGGPVSSFKTVDNGDGSFGLFIQDPNGNLFHQSFKAGILGATTGATDLQKIETNLQEFQVVQRPDGRQAVFTVDRNSLVSELVQDGAGANTFTQQSTLPFITQRVHDLQAAVDGNGNVELAAVGANNQVFQATETGPGSGSFPAWADLGMTASVIAMGKNADGRLQLFMGDGNGVVSYLAQSQPGNWQGNPEKSWPAPAAGIPISSLETRVDDGKIVLRVGTAPTAGLSRGVFETEQIAPNQSDNFSVWNAIETPSRPI